LTDGWTTILVLAVILATAADAVLIAWLIFG
jgi:hypothetical protein